ncbi:MAG: 23S rRNA (pseudouridine(1915)-N(3))-methyltransferase RlmH [Clostridia bacterium]|nr:23S rRNA (pseudouridine(1915)-N(3))-methyltransferase RlmH [Clostridia bacterium]
MKIRIVCVGKLKKTYLEAAEQDYSRLLGRYCSLEIVQLREEAPKGTGPKAEQAAREVEAQRILSRLDGFVVCLDPRGQRMTSERFAAFVDRMCAEGRSLCFVIGGSTGLADAVRARSDMTLSLSDMTMPHHLFRIVLLEQIYRAFKIARGETYHK